MTNANRLIKKARTFEDQKFPAPIVLVEPAQANLLVNRYYNTKLHVSKRFVI